MVEARVADQRTLAEDVQLRPLVPGLVDLHEHTPVREVEALDGLRVVGQLGELAAGGRQREQLARARKVGGHEQRRAVRRPRERVRLAKLEELAGG